MIRRCLVLAVLAGCTAAAPSGTYRKAGSPIYSNAVFQQERFGGHWLQVADFAPPGAAACAASGLAVTPGGDGQFGLKGDLCLGGQRRGFDGMATVSGPGRLRVAGAGGSGLDAEWWVLWVDDGYRTVVIGTPSGSFGIILNRDAVLPADRLTAAREILDWNGYDLGRMRMVTPR